MMSDKLNRKFCIEKQELEDRLHYSLKRNNSEYNLIIPLRDVAVVEDMAFMRQDVLRTIIANIPLRNSGELPYKNSEISIYSLEPKGVKVGQTFVSEQKIIAIMGNMQRVFSEFVTKGVSKMPPAHIFGKDHQGQNVAAFYIPPIVEHFNHTHALLDGMHRSYICSSAGTTVNAIHIYNSQAKLPFTPISWDEVSVVIEKPPIKDRYLNLDTSLFRDLGYVGIDG
jgi:hypothetical protein